MKRHQPSTRLIQHYNNLRKKRRIRERINVLNQKKARNVCEQQLGLEFEKMPETNNPSCSILTPVPRLEQNGANTNSKEHLNDNNLVGSLEEITIPVQKGAEISREDDNPNEESESESDTESNCTSDDTNRATAEAKSRVRSTLSTSGIHRAPSHAKSVERNKCDNNGPLVDEEDSFQSSATGEAAVDRIITRTRGNRSKGTQILENNIDMVQAIDLDTILLDNDDSLDELQLKQREELRRRTSRPGRRSTFMGAEDDSTNRDRTIDFDEELYTPEHLWRDIVTMQLQRQPEFFKSPEARMILNDPVRAGKPAYQGLGVSPSNCLDLQVVYKDSHLSRELFGALSCRRYSGKYDRRTYTETFKQLLCVVGQLMRWAIVRRKIGPFDGWKQDSLFNCVADEQLVSTFVEYFRLRGSASTVNTKTIHLRTVCRSVINRSSDNPSRKDAVNIVHSYLSKTGTACKQTARRNKSADRRMNSQEKWGKIIQPEDFARMITLAEKDLDGIVEAVKLDRIENRRSSDSYLFFHRKGLARRWNLNFLALLMFVSSGQRPQVFHQLQCPSQTQIDFWLSSSYNGRYIQLETIDEKRARSTDIPCVSIPRKVTKYIDFHIRVVRKYIIDVTGMRDQKEDCPLLIHTETGDYLGTKNITFSLRAFLTDKDPELRHVTTMSLRASYATLMFRAHRERKIFRDLNEDQFLRELGKMMNTSLEQLREVYVVCGSEEYHDTATQICSYLENQYLRSRNLDSPGDSRNNCFENDPYESERIVRGYLY